MDTDLYERSGKAITNFTSTLPSTQGELAPKLQVARQTLYNWRDEGWMVTTDSGKPDLKNTIRLWEDLNWVTGHNLA